MLSFWWFLLRWLYTGLFVLATPFILLRLYCKSLKNPAYRARWAERFGIFKFPLPPGGLWIHAVSVGESVTAIPLVLEFQKRFPALPITVTTSTPTGSARVQSVLKNQVFHMYFPYDLPWCFGKALKVIRPKLMILMETELWPNCLWQCKQRHIPVMIANGRLSPRSIREYGYVQFVAKQMLACVNFVAAQSLRDGANFIALGLAPERLVVTGNIKFDLTLKEGTKTEAQLLRETWGKERLVFVAASTHGGEEEQILTAFSEIRRQFKDALLIAVPRHPERFSGVAELIKRQGYSMVLRSSGLNATSKTQAFLGDTMGELDLFYAASDVAFVGGSLVAIGGHNTLEPAAQGVPVVVGSHVHNFVEVTQLLLDAGALVQVSNSHALAEAVLHWFKMPAARKRAGSAGKAVVERNRGAVTKIVDLAQNNFLN
jgi:3-deoxy-D-manno-octulosonic-acid transferase